MAANLDTVFVVCGLDRDYNLRRIERYLNLIYNCGLNPAIILTKADLHQDPSSMVDEVEAIAFGVPIHLVSALDNQGLSDLEPHKKLRHQGVCGISGNEYRCVTGLPEYGYRHFAADDTYRYLSREIPGHKVGSESKGR